jgi:hypothetical protein
MNNATPSAEGKAYTSWKLSFPLLDGKNQLVEMIQGVQELYVGS